MIVQLEGYQTVVSVYTQTVLLTHCAIIVI